MGSNSHGQLGIDSKLKLAKSISNYSNKIVQVESLKHFICTKIDCGNNFTATITSETIKYFYSSNSQ